jgi:ribosomal protein uL22
VCVCVACMRVVGLTPGPASCGAAVKARGSHLRVHFKNTRNVANAVKGMSLLAAKAFLVDVLAHKQAIPITRFKKGCGRHAQGKARNTPGSLVHWPEKSVKFMADLLKNAEANAEVGGGGRGARARALALCMCAVASACTRARGCVRVCLCM